MSVVIYHNPACGTSRNTLAMIRATGAEPEVVLYRDAPPTREKLVGLLDAMGIGPRQLLRQKGAPYGEFGLDDPALTDDDLIDAMMAHPILINRPIVEAPRGAKLCRPSKEVLSILDSRLRADFTKEDGQVIRANV